MDPFDRFDHTGEREAKKDQSQQRDRSLARRIVTARLGCLPLCRHLPIMFASTIHSTLSAMMPLTGKTFAL